MAALVDGQRYGLSSQAQNSENRTSISVRLTDPALKAIEEYLIFRGTTSRQPTIQFVGSQGVITFPSSHNVGGEHSFDFSFVPCSETEGLKGSFETIKKTGSRSLETVGRMQYKMHIQAKEDIYERTKFRMAAAEEESKKNCTKVIKAAGPYVGRKVKVKKGLSSIPPKPIASSPPYSSFSKSSLSAVNKPTMNNGHHMNGVLANVNGTGYHSNNTSSSSNNNNALGASKNAPLAVNSKVTGNPDIRRRPFRERIIHILATRPHKKPELLSRLMKDGIKDKDRRTLSAMLSHVSVMRDNSFELARHVWNEVQEDWPFYNEIDRQLLKSRMPQNLTPPGGDSELSPSSMMLSGSSPPQVQKRQMSNSGSIPSKKQRISHYKKPEVTTNNLNGLSKPQVDVTQLNTRKQQQGGPPNGGGQANGHYRQEDVNGFVAGGLNSYSEPLPVKIEPDFGGGYNSSTNNHHHQNNRSSLGYLSKMDSTGFVPSTHNSYVTKESKVDSGRPSSLTTGTMNGYASNNHRSSNGNYNGRSNGKVASSSALCNGSTGGSRHSTPSSSPDSQDNIDLRGSNSRHSNGSSSPTSVTELPDHLKKYTVITTAEQRAHYKAEFNAEYDGYREIHAIIERVSRRFTVLEEHLRNTKEGSDESLRIKDQILKEYKENKRNQSYQEAKKRFNYLHQKLSHIKKLVLDYDILCDS